MHMSNHDRSREAALKFMDYLGRKGLMAPATARSRKAALSKVLSVLDAEEATDVTQLDLDQTMSRFSNLQGQGYTPQSLQTYKSRVKSALDDFNAYLENPLGFRPRINQRTTSSVPRLTADGQPPTTSQISDASQRRPNLSDDFVNATILPIPIRPDVTVRIQGLPFDLTPQEAGKIAAVVKAMAVAE
jgi:hypothetical protein